MTESERLKNAAVPLPRAPQTGPLAGAGRAALARELGLASAAAIVISNMIGTGVFGAAGFLARDLGRPWMVVGIWVAGAMVALAGCLCYSELGVNYPRSGGEYVYLREIWGPMWGFLSGWVSFFAGFSAPIAASALLFSEYLGQIFPRLSPQTGAVWIGSKFFTLGAGQAVALALIGAFTAVNYFGVRVAARVQNVLTALKVLMLVAFVALGFGVGSGDWGHFAAHAARESALPIAGQFAVSLVFVMYAYSGWNAAAYVAEELKSPERTLPRALVLGTVAVAVLYVALNATFVYALPMESMRGVGRVGVVAAIALFGNRVGGVFAGMIAAALVSCVSAMVIAGPRVYYAMARDGCFFPDAARIHPRWRSPGRAVVYQALASGVMVLTSTFEALGYYIGFALVMFAALATAGLIKARRRPEWRRLGAVSRAYPLVPGVFVAASLWMLASTLAARPKESLWGLLTIACGALLYRLQRGRR